MIAARKAHLFKAGGTFRILGQRHAGEGAQVRRRDRARIVHVDADHRLDPGRETGLADMAEHRAENRPDLRIGTAMGEPQKPARGHLDDLHIVHGTSLRCWPSIPRRTPPRIPPIAPGGGFALIPEPGQEFSAVQNYLDFEKGLAEIEGKAEELRALARKNTGMNVEDEAAGLDRKAAAMLDDLYKALDPWQKCQVARHPERPHCKDYIEGLFTEWTPLAGDRNFADDHAVMGGLARLDDRAVMVIGHEKGNDTKSRIERNFGMARPEGYRKAIRLMDLADRMGLPVVTLIDTPGAYPGKGAEERGQAEAIARSTEKCLSVGVPLVSVIIGEGGSGGAVAFATADRLAMLEHSIYSVISPEGCASILWKDSEKMKEAAAALRLTAQDLLTLGVADRIIPEPRGGAQRDRADTVARVGVAITEMLGELDGVKPAKLRAARRAKYLAMGSTSLVA